MNFFKQIFAEMKHMIRSKFLLISWIVIFSFICIAVPIISAVQNNDQNDYYYYWDDTPIIVDGVEIEMNNDFSWELRNLLEQQEYLSEMFSDSTTTQYAMDYCDLLIDFYVTYASDIEGYEDYRQSYVYQMKYTLREDYFLSLEDPDIAKFTEAINFFEYDTILFDTDLSDAERQAQMDANAAKWELFDRMMLQNDFSAYVELKRADYQSDIDLSNQSIAQLEADIAKDPSLEESYNETIQATLLDIQNTEEISLPELDYRAEYNIVPNDGSWQDAALNQQTSSQRTILHYADSLMSEEDFYDSSWSVQEYTNYKNYLTQQEKSLQEAEVTLFVAQSSLESGKPDMSYVDDGARAKTHGQLAFTLLIAMFGILVGGWSIANEFQAGTVRLLMVRPRTRAKVLFSRFFAGLILTYLLYLAVFVVAGITNGFIYGFADYFYPNYTASGEIPYVVTLLSHVFAVSTSLIFLYTLAFTVSSIVKNIAVGVIIPTLGIIGGFVLTQMLYALPLMQWLSFTPVSYLMMYNFYDQYSVLSTMQEKGMLVSTSAGVLVMLCYSVALMAVSYLLFKKQDITN